jgi:hypothetical protein
LLLVLPMLAEMRLVVIDMVEGRGGEVSESLGSCVTRLLCEENRVGVDREEDENERVVMMVVFGVEQPGVNAQENEGTKCCRGSKVRFMTSAATTSDAIT